MLAPCRKTGQGWERNHPGGNVEVTVASGLDGVEEWEREHLPQIICCHRAFRNPAYHHHTSGGGGSLSGAGLVASGRRRVARVQVCAVGLISEGGGRGSLCPAGLVLVKRLRLPIAGSPLSSFPRMAVSGWRFPQ